MNPKLLRTAVRITEKGHKIQSRLLMPYTRVRGDSELYILKVDGRVKPFKVLAVINPYMVSTDAYRNRQVFEVATTREDFGEESNLSFGQIVGQATHVYTHPQRNLFNIRNGDEVCVEMMDFTYRIYGFQVLNSFVKFDPPMNLDLKASERGELTATWVSQPNQTSDFELEFTLAEG